MIFDSHCHIHDSKFFPENREEVYRRAIEANTQMIVVGTSEDDAREAVNFANSHEGVWAVVGVHPHDTKSGWEGVGAILADYLIASSTPLPSSQIPSESARRSLGSGPVSESAPNSEKSEISSELGAAPLAATRGDNLDPKIVGIGEIGLDYFYDNSPRDVQIRALEQQLQWAVDYNLPVSFHVREAYADFWPVFDNFTGVRGVLHCFTDTQETLEKALARNLYIGVNGISTFTKDAEQQAMFAALPLESMLLETDAPFLTPRPFRGKMNEPVYVVEVARHQAEVKNLALDTVISKTTASTKELFAID